MDRSKLWDLVLAKKGLTIFAKVFTFALGLVWTLGLVYVGLLSFSYLLVPMIRAAGVPPHSMTSGFLQAWYIITLIILAVVSVVKGLGFIGRWEKE